jgi:hypothetical protein
MAYDDLIESAARAQNIDPGLIRAVIQTESSGNPKAVSGKGAVGLGQLMPATAKSLGVSDPTDPKQAIPAIAALLNENLTRYGNVPDALRAYHGGTDQKNWGQLTQAYPQKVLSNMGQTMPQTLPGIPTSQPQGDQSDDAIFAAFSGGKAQPQQQAQSGLSDDQIFSAFTQAQEAPKSKIAVSPKSAVVPQSQAESATSQAAHQLGLFARAGITGVSALPNMVGNALNSAINIGTSGINKVAGTHIPQLGMPSQATQNLMNMGGISQPRNGMEQAVQDAASSVAAVRPTVGLGKLLAGASNSLARTIGTAFQEAPGLQMLGGAGAGAAGSIAAQSGAGAGGQLGASLLGSMLGVGAARAGQSLAALLGAPNEQQMLAQAMRDQANNAAVEPVKPRVKLNVDGSVQPIAQVPATAPSKPFAPPATAPEGGSLNTQRQLENIELMKKIGLNEQRPSAISGNKFQAGMEYENTKLDNQVGQVARDQLAKEQQAIKSYASNIVADTGATAGTPEAIGQSIRAPLQGLSDYFDAQIGKLYDAAKENAGGMGAVDPKNLNALIGNNDFRESLLSSPAGTTLLGSIERQIKRFQGAPIPGETPPPAPNTVNSAENLRKWLNSQWSPGNSRLIGQVKEALDTDVANAGGSGVFDQARALHGLRKDTLDNPNGISKLLTEKGPGGINQAIPDEKVASNLLTMPTGQFSHVLETLSSLPDNLAPQGNQAIAEIRGALAKRIYQAGDSGGTQNGPSMWNAANVTRAMNANRSKMDMLFTPEQLDRFNTLHDVGHILQSPTAYKGAAAQGYNFLQSGAVKAPALGLAGLGAYLGGPVGSMLGGALGSVASGAAKAKIDASMAQKLSKSLQNPSPNLSR